MKCLMLLPILVLTTLAVLTTPARADQTVFLNYESTSCTQYIAHTDIVGDWYSGVTGDQFAPKGATTYLGIGLAIPHKDRVPTE